MGMDMANVPTEEETKVDDLLNTINGLLELANGERVELEEPPKLSEQPWELDEKKLEEEGMYDVQIDEIKLGVEANLPAQIYAKNCYNWLQMREIRLGLLAGVEVENYLNPLFTPEQMREIRIGLEEGVNATSYAKLIYSGTDMFRKRRQLMADVYRESNSGKRLVIIDEITGARIQLSEDCMEAYLLFPKQLKHKITLPGLKRLLKKNEITFGIIDDQIQKIAKEPIQKEELKVAQGIPPLEGTDGTLELFFNNTNSGKPKILPDGRVDYSSVMVADSVEPGQLLARYIPAKRGKNGMTVTGIPIEGKNGIEMPPLQGSGFIFDEKTGEYKALLKGYVAYNEKEGLLHVLQTYTSNGDINRYTGSVVFDGNVHIRGNVGDMATIKATGDVIIDGFVNNATIQAGNNIVIRGGANGAGKGSIVAGNSIVGDFFEHVTLKAKGPIEGNYFMNCEIDCEDKVMSKGSKGVILGGKITAIWAVETAVIGSEGTSKTEIVVGDVFTLDRKLEVLQVQKSKVEKEIELLESGKEKLLETYGKEMVEGNAIYKKTVAAIEAKKNEERDVVYGIERCNKLRMNAQKGYIKATQTLHRNVIVTINGIKAEILDTYKATVLDREKMVALKKRR